MDADIAFKICILLTGVVVMSFGAHIFKRALHFSVKVFSQPISNQLKDSRMLWFVALIGPLCMLGGFFLIWHAA